MLMVQLSHHYHLIITITCTLSNYFLIITPLNLIMNLYIYSLSLLHAGIASSTPPSQVEFSDRSSPCPPR